jgi:hypothetical protein
MKESAHGPHGNFVRDSVIDIDAKIGGPWIEAGIAEPVRGPVVERAVAELDAEAAVAEPVKKKRASKKRSAKKD